MAIYTVRGGGGFSSPPLDIGGWLEFWDSEPFTFSLTGTDITSWSGLLGRLSLSNLGVLVRSPSNVAQINGVNVVDFDGVANWISVISTNIDREPPLSVPTVYWGIFLIDTAAATETLCHAGGAATLEISSLNAAGDIGMSNGVVGANANADPVLGTAFRMYAEFVGSIADSLRVDSNAAVTGATAGNANPVSSLSVGSRSGAAGTFFDGKCAAFGIRNTKLSAAEQTALAVWANGKYATPL